MKIFQSRVKESTTNTAVSSGSSVTIYDSNTEGHIEGRINNIAVYCNDDDFSVEVILDGTTIYNKTFDVLDNEHKFLYSTGGNSGNNSLHGVPSVDASEKKFRHLCMMDYNFESSAQVKVHNNGGSSKKIYSYWVEASVPI